MKNLLMISTLILTVYLLTNLIIPFTLKGEMIFFSNIVLWSIVIAITVVITKHQRAEIWHTNKTLIQLAIVIATFQVFLLIFASFFMGFAKNANVWTPAALALYFPYLLSSFLAIEISRTFLAKTTSQSRQTIQIIFISLFTTLITVSTSTYMSLTTPLAISEFLVKTLIPTLSTNILATYLASIGGLPTNLIYMAIPAFFTWFSPILPNPPWAAKSAMTLIATTAGFLYLDKASPPPHPKQIHRTLKKQKSQLPYWTVVGVIGLVAIWSSTGLLGFTPVIVASGSMNPTLNPGDITLVTSTPPATIKVGDVIQYRTTDAPITHRVIDKYEAGGFLWFVTKGDANNAPDTNPISENDVMGKVVFTIPQLGWVSVAIKEFASLTYTFFTTTLPQTLTNTWTWIVTNGVYLTSALTFTAYSYLLLTYKTVKKGGKTKNE